MRPWGDRQQFFFLLLKKRYSSGWIIVAAVVLVPLRFGFLSKSRPNAKDIEPVLLLLLLREPVHLHGELGMAA